MYIEGGIVVYYLWRYYYYIYLPQSLRCVYAKPLRVIESLTNELEAYTSKRKIGLLRLVRLILTTDY